MDAKKLIVKTDCKFYRGDSPCVLHKQYGVHCDKCKYYSQTGKRILIINLGAKGNVLRATPLLRKLNEACPNNEITWLTYSPEVLPKAVNVLTFEPKNIQILLATKFDILINLDKAQEACALASMINADVKKGFTLKNGKCYPFDDGAKPKWLNGLFDDLNNENKKSYLEEIFEIAGFKFNGEKYLIDVEPSNFGIKKNKPVVGFNVGVREKWRARLWPKEYWTELAKLLKKKYDIVLLGGENEDVLNKEIAAASGAIYLGYFPFRQFVSLMNECDLVVTSVTLGLHVAIALEKKIVLFNNIFNRHEFELYGLGKILEPNVPCKGCYKQDYDEKCPTKCMELIKPEDVCREVERLLVK